MYICLQRCTCTCLQVNDLLVILAGACFRSEKPVLGLGWHKAKNGIQKEACPGSCDDLESGRAVQVCFS